MRKGFLTAVVLLASTSALGQDKGASVGDSDEAALKRLRQEIVQMIGDPVCANLVYCRVLALGVKSCGAPDEYLAYSNTAKTDTDQLQVKASEYAFLQEELLAGKPPASDCRLPKKPAVRCVDQRCRLVP